MITPVAVLDQPFKDSVFFGPPPAANVAWSMYRIAREIWGPRFIMRRPDHRICVLAWVLAGEGRLRTLPAPHPLPSTRTT